MVNFILREPVPYFSQLDENNFFRWLQRIPAVSKVEGGHKGLKIILKMENIDARSTEEFSALFARYSLDIELPNSIHKGRAVSLKRRATPASVTLMERSSNGFSLSLRPRFVSRMDERGFHTWLKKIQPRYTSPSENKTALLELNSDEVTVRNVSDLMAIFRRYYLSLSKLKRLRTISGYDHHWEDWREEVFETSRSS